MYPEGKLRKVWWTVHVPDIERWWGSFWESRENYLNTFFVLLFLPPSGWTLKSAKRTHLFLFITFCACVFCRNSNILLIQLCAKHFLNGFQTVYNADCPGQCDRHIWCFSLLKCKFHFSHFHVASRKKQSSLLKPACLLLVTSSICSLPSLNYWNSCVSNTVTDTELWFNQRKGKNTKQKDCS